MSKIAVMTSGGDAAGMNGALRAVVRSAMAEGLEVIGIERGFMGLVEHAFIPLHSKDVSGIIARGGTILRTFRCPDFQNRAVRDAAAVGLKAQGVEGLVVIGGDGSFRGAHCIDAEWDIPTIGVPATIDNDIKGTDYSIGYDTALNIATDAVDKIRDTATSHGRIFVIEVMGRNSGLLALATGLCCGAEEVLIPEIEIDIQAVCKRIESGYDRGKHHAIIIVAEGASQATTVTDQIKHHLSREVRFAVLGHIQRGGDPTAFDRILGSRLGVAAVQMLLLGQRDVMVGQISGKVETTPLLKGSGYTPPILQAYERLHELLS